MNFVIYAMLKTQMNRNRCWQHKRYIIFVTIHAVSIKCMGYIKVDGVSSVFCFIWGWEEPTWGLPFQFHGVFYVMISMKGP